MKIRSLPAFLPLFFSLITSQELAGSPTVPEVLRSKTCLQDEFRVEITFTGLINWVPLTQDGNWPADEAMALFVNGTHAQPPHSPVILSNCIDPRDDSTCDVFNLHNYEMIIEPAPDPHSLLLEGFNVGYPRITPLDINSGCGVVNPSLLGPIDRQETRILSRLHLTHGALRPIDDCIFQWSFRTCRTCNPIAMYNLEEGVQYTACLPGDKLTLKLKRFGGIPPMITLEFPADANRKVSILVRNDPSRADWEESGMPDMQQLVHFRHHYQTTTCSPAQIKVYPWAPWPFKFKDTQCPQQRGAGGGGPILCTSAFSDTVVLP